MPLRTILTVDAVVIATWVLYRLIGRLREVILWILIAAFIALVLNPAVNFLQRHRFRRGAAIGCVFAIAVVVFAGLLGLFGYPLVNSLTHVAEQLPTMVDQVQKGHGWLAHTLQRFHLLTWVQKNAPKLETAAKNLSKPALSEGANLGEAVFSTILPSPPSPSCPCSCCWRPRGSGRGLLGTMRPDRRRTVEDIAHRVSHQVTGYVLGTIALSVMFGVVVMVTMLILGVPFALLIGLWVALVAMIPLVGGLIAAVPSVLLAFLHSPDVRGGHAHRVRRVPVGGEPLPLSGGDEPVGADEPAVGAAVGADRRQPGRRLRFGPRRPGRRAGGHPGRWGDPGDLPRGVEPDPGRRRRAGSGDGAATGGGPASGDVGPGRDHRPAPSDRSVP